MLNLLKLKIIRMEMNRFLGEVNPAIWDGFSFARLH